MLKLSDAFFELGQQPAGGGAGSSGMPGQQLGMGMSAGGGAGQLLPCSQLLLLACSMVRTPCARSN